MRILCLSRQTAYDQSFHIIDIAAEHKSTIILYNNARIISIDFVKF